MRKNLLILLAVLFLGFVAFIIFSADNGSMPKFIANLYNFPNGDKVGHFVLFGLLSFVINLSVFEARPLADKKRLAIITSLILALFVGLEEYSQRFFPKRTADIFDFLASCAGIAFFAWLAVKLKS